MPEPQLGVERQAFGRVVILRRFVDGVPAAAALGDVHRDVGALQEHLGILAVLGIQRHAEAAADVQAGAIQLERLLQHLQHAGSHRQRAGLVDARQQDRELVATQAGQRVHLAHRARQSPADQSQQRVASLMAQRIVDVFEAVQVQQQERKRRLVALCLRRSPARDDRSAAVDSAGRSGHRAGSGAAGWPARASAR